MKLPFLIRTSITLLAMSIPLLTGQRAEAQFTHESLARWSDSSSASIIAAFRDADQVTSAAGGDTVVPPLTHALRPFSRLSLGVGISPLGIGLQAATNINRHFNIRATGNIFDYTADNISTEGFNVTAKINMASAGASVDYYPFHTGFRLSPGVLFYNGNKADVTFVAGAGTSFSLDNHTYYSASGAQAVVGTGFFGLGNGRAAFTATTGWGNVIPASGRHFSFPFEIGVAFIKEPTVALNLSGYVCDAHGQNCVDVATDSTAQADLAAQVKSYQNDVNPLKTYPIVSFGVAYNFRIR